MVMLEERRLTIHSFNGSNVLERNQPRRLGPSDSSLVFVWRKGKEVSMRSKLD